MMTHNEMIAVIQAHKDGKKIQCRISGSSGPWLDLELPKWSFYASEYRIAPEPKMRAWRLEEVPMPITIRNTGKNEHRWMALAASNDGVVVIGSGGKPPKLVSFTDLLERCEHSTDGGKTWLPCGVLKE